MGLRGSDQAGFPLVGFGLPAIAALLWLARARRPEQETIAGAARLASIVAIVVVLGLIIGTGNS